MQIDTPEQRPRTAAAHVSLSPKTASRTGYRSAHLRVKSIAKIKIRIKGINVTSCVSITGLLKEAVSTRKKSLPRPERQRVTNHVGSNPEKERYLINISVQRLGGKSQTIQHAIK